MKKTTTSSSPQPLPFFFAPKRLTPFQIEPIIQVYYKDLLMPVYSLRLTDAERSVLNDYAKAHGITMADALKGAFFDMLEDQYDIEVGDKAYEAYLNDPETISIEEMVDKYGL